MGLLSRIVFSRSKGRADLEKQPLRCSGCSLKQSDVIVTHFWVCVSLSQVCADIIYYVDERGECPNLTTPRRHPILTRCLSFNSMVEPSPSALHLSSGGDVSMAGLGVKLEQEESCRGRGLATSMEALKASPSRDWSGSHPLEVRQLTPPLSCSPSVRRRGARKVAEAGEKLRLCLCPDRMDLQVKSCPTGRAPQERRTFP